CSTPIPQIPSACLRKYVKATMTSLGLATALDNARADPTQVCGRAVRGTDVACTRTSRLPGGPRPSRPLSAHHRGRPVRPSITPCCHLSLSRLNYQWPECEGHPEMMEGIAARNLCLQRGLKG